MKLLLVVVVVGAIGCVVLFLVGVFSPERQKKLQRKAQGLARRAENKTDSSAGRLGDLTRDAIKRARRVGTHSARAGRSLHARITRSKSSN